MSLGKSLEAGSLLEQIERGTMYDYAVEEAHKKASPQMLAK